jgi:hypothetical protein
MIPQQVNGVMELELKVRSGAGWVTQEVEHLPSKHEALSSSSGTIKKKVYVIPTKPFKNAFAMVIRQEKEIKREVKLLIVTDASQS